MERIEGEYCKVCGKPNPEEHHIIKRSQAKFLINCKLNKVYLCAEEHRGKFGVHGKNGSKLDKALKLEMQQNLEILMDKQYFTREEVKDILQINEKNVNSLCKLIKQDKCMFARDNIIIAIMGGKKVTEEEVKELNESTDSY